MIKILTINAGLSKNKGSGAMLISTIEAIRKDIPNSHFTINTPFPELDKKNCKIKNVTMVTHKRKSLKYIARFFLSMILYVLPLRMFVKDPVLRDYLDSDIILDLGGDGLTDDYGIIATITSCYNLLLCNLLRKPLVIYAQSIGPFKNKFTRALARYCLNRVSLLIVREEITYNYLKRIGIKNKIHFTADSAFLLAPASKKRVEDIFAMESITLDKRMKIGISASQHMYNAEQNKTDSTKNKYVDFMANLVDSLINRFDAQIIFVPHVTNKDILVDDKFVGDKIYNKVKNKNNIYLIKNKDYSPGELKGIIGSFDMFIGARMHSNIASTSMHVPTIAIAYSHKFYGIMKMLGMDKYVLDFRTMSLEQVMSKIEELWEERRNITSELKSKIKILKNKALENVKLTKTLLSSSVR